MTSSTTAPSPETDYEDELAVTVFSKNDCTDCNNTKRLFDRKGVPYREINVETDTEPRDEFDGLTPFDHVTQNYARRMPVVVVEDGSFGDWWAGTRPDKLMATIKRFTEADQLIPEDQRKTAA